MSDFRTEFVYSTACKCGLRKITFGVGAEKRNLGKCIACQDELKSKTITTINSEIENQIENVTSVDEKIIVEEIGGIE